MPTQFSAWLHRAYAQRLNVRESRTCLEEAERYLTAPLEESEPLADAWWSLFRDGDRAAAALRRTRECDDPDVWSHRIDLLAEWLHAAAEPHIVQTLKDAADTGDFEILHVVNMQVALSTPEAGATLDRALVPFILLNESRAATVSEFESCVLDWLFQGASSDPENYRHLVSCVENMERRSTSLDDWLLCAETWDNVHDHDERVQYCIRQAARLQRTWEDRVTVAQWRCWILHSDLKACEPVLAELESHAATPEQRQECDRVRASLREGEPPLEEFPRFPDEVPPVDE